MQSQCNKHNNADILRAVTWKASDRFNDQLLTHTPHSSFFLSKYTYQRSHCWWALNWVEDILAVFRYVALVLAGQHLEHYSKVPSSMTKPTLQWRHNELHGVPNHQRPDCLLNRLLSCRSKKTSKLCVTVLCEGNSPVTVTRWPVTREMFPFDDVIMIIFDSIVPYISSTLVSDGII